MKEYKDNTILLVCLGVVWVLAAWLGTTDYPNLAILVLFIGITLFNPLLKIVRKIMGLKQIHPDNPLKMLLTCMSIGVPAGMIIGFFPFQDNINMFFPAFSILFGIIFVVIAYVYKLKLFAFMGILLIAGNTYIAMSYEKDFTSSGFYTGAVIIGFGIINKIIGVIDLRNFVSKTKKMISPRLKIKKKVKVPINSVPSV